MTDSPRRRPLGTLLTAWVGRAALLFVLVTLVALVVVPLLVQQRVERLRTEIEAADPARTIVTQLQFNLVREMASLSELVLTGNQEYAATYRSALDAERALFAELRPLVVQLGDDLVAHVDVAQATAERWHRRVAADEIVRRTRGSLAASDISRESPLLEQALQATARIDSAVVRAADGNRREIAEAEQAGIRLTVLLGAFAIAAAIAVAMLDARVRRFAVESEIQRHEAERALAETARVNEARAGLIRGITHDVKNPLGAAKGYAELLMMGVKGPLHPDQLPLLRGIERSVDGALAIIADLLDVARADSGGLTVHLRPTDVDALAREMVEQHRAAAEAAGLVLLHEPAAEPVIAETDATRVQQVLGNLLSNAVKYTPPPGRITVAAAGGEDSVAVRVTDTGPGIPANLREAIFDEFTRVDDEAPVKGHGLGLAIARRVARILGGDLTVEDARGGGSVFSLRLPVKDRRSRHDRRR